MQNFKKEVNIYDRILCILLAAAVSSAFILCSFSCPLCASAGDVSPLDAVTIIDQFAEDVYTAHDRVKQAVREDFENGNVDATSALGQQYLLAIALQAAAVSNPQVNAAILLAQAYEDGQAEAQDWIDWYNSNRTLTIGSSHIASGYYRLSSGGDLRMCSVYTFPDWSSSNFGATFISADDYSYYLDCDNPSAAQCCCYNDNYNGSLFYEFQLKSRVSDWSQNVNISLTGSGIGYSRNDWMGFNNGSGTTSRSIDFRGSDRGYNYIPVYNKIEPQYGFPNPLFACGVYSDIPSAQVDTSNVYDYYNDTILPLVKQECPDVPDNYYYFYGNEYGPAQDPTEPPLFPFTQPWQNDFVYPQTETSVSIINPTATDNSGSTYTETTIVTVPVTETSASYVPVYGFNVPLLPNLETVTATLPAETIPPQTAQKITDLWAFVKWILDESGMFPIFLALVSIGFVMFIIRFIGG